ncbi:ArsR/SmtB family transcription factor [Qipengyuania sp.]|uniref:ArsR/SmtB family transcription factor n=1 Tax=Qipengyuania sp. TaxID=2004515 RepID=UPI003AF7E4B8
MTEEELVDALKAVAHPVRLRILQTLAGGERNVGEIDDAARIGQPSLSQQLAVLRNAGLVTTRKQAKLVYYRIDAARLAAMSSVLGGIAGVAVEPARAPRRPSPGVAAFARLG